MEAKVAITQIKDILKLIETLKPKFWIIENRLGKLRKLNLINNDFLGSVTLCQYSENRNSPLPKDRPAMARTDLWTNFYDIWTELMCKNGDSCHVSAKRGSSSEVKKDVGEKEKFSIPKETSHEIIKALEHNI